MLICSKPKIFDVDIYGLAALLGLAAGAWLFLVRPLDDKIYTTRQEQETMTQQKQAEEHKLAELQQIARQRDQLAVHLSQTANPLRESTGIAEIIRQLGRFCRESRVRLDEITTGAAGVSEYYRKNTVELKLRGRFQSFRSLLHQIAEQMQFIRIDTFSLSRDSADEQGVCRIQMQLDVFSPK